MRRTTLLALLGTCAGAAPVAVPVAAETHVATATAHPIYRCEVGGRTLYTDKPCIGARVVPTALQGMQPASDTESAQSGDTLGWTEENGSAAESYVWNPYASRARSMPLAPPVNPACPHLAQRMALVEAEERAAPNALQAAIQERLSIQRQRFRELGC